MEGREDGEGTFVVWDDKIPPLSESLGSVFSAF
jgi:hypothetical protein